MSRKIDPGLLSVENEIAIMDDTSKAIQECDVLRLRHIPNLITRLRQFIEDEARSGSMEPALITPEYVYRMWGGKVPLEDIEAAMKQL